MNNILFELIVSRQCNKRCKYCDLEFESEYQTEARLREFSNFLRKNYNQADSLLINFFWWEAMLDYAGIQKFIAYNSGIPNIRYSLWTNGILINNAVAEYLQAQKIELYFSIDTESQSSIYEKKSLREYQNITVNFILNPNTIAASEELLRKLISLGYKKFNFIPVFSTIRWNIPSFALLGKFKEFVELQDSIIYTFYSYYEKPTSDIQFVLDTDGYVYRDIHTHFWIMKQLSYLSQEQKKDIELFTQVEKMNEGLDIFLLIEKYNQKELIKKSYDLAKTIWYDRDFRILDKIL